ncbi:serine/threonine protein kinase [Gigaspora margarita]|uniref:Serine/threonine protein kinase n=1 Tax=Gigaspora margarita TaxID=4874 RepID=A0A8H4B471_GIGMA|nr:serine/threonine protein kinase [Gigaspora margarita]
MAIIPCKECGQGIDAEICWCKPCNSKRFEDDFPNWTSNSSEIDKFIQETQKNSERPETIFEWFDYSKFTILKQIEFSKNNKAYWEDGHILSWNEKSNKWNRHGGQWVKLVTHYCEKYLTSNFLKSEYEFSKVNPSNRLVYGMTRDPATKDYAVVEKLIDICPFCGQEWMCLRWCRGCHANRFKSEFQNWTSGNEDIDSFIHDTQLTAEFPEQVLEWIPESQFMKFDEIGRGGFGTVFKAYWKKGRIQKWCTISGEWKRDDPMWVAMKSVENDDECGLLEEVG